MKKIFILLIAFFTFHFSGKSQYVSIPDNNFRQFFIDYYPSCMNASNMLDTSCSAIVNETQFNIFSNGAIANWDGFQYFKNLQTATFSMVDFTYIPNLPATLKELVVQNQNLSVMPTLPNGLTHLKLSGSNNISGLPILPNSLVYLDCSYNSNLQNLSSLPASLRYFNCEGCNSFTSLLTLPASLDTLICNYCNQLSSLSSLPPALKLLSCIGSQFTSLPTLPATLKYIDCSSSHLQMSLPELPISLEYLDAQSSLLSSLPSLPPGLKTLLVSQNILTTLPSLPTSLESLYFGLNLINSLPPLPANLILIEGSYNQLTSLPALPSGLQSLNFNNNQLTTIPELPQSLKILRCNANSLTSLPALPDHINQIECGSNQLTSLPPLPHDLISLVCPHNQIYFLPALPDTLMGLVCFDNNITCLPVLPPGWVGPGSLFSLSMDDKINCIPNEPGIPYLINLFDSNVTSLGYFNSYPLCSAVNNIHHCDAFPLMTGYAYNDNNNNSIKDANEPYRANVKVELSNGAFTMTNSNGYYQIPADSIGNYSVTATAPNFFTSLPPQYNYNFNSYDTLITNDFALQATSTVDSLTISVLPINWAASPGFAFPYLISYQNVGTTTLSPNIVFNYDNTRLIYDSSSNAAVINSGSALSLSEMGFVAGEQKTFVGYFRVNPAAVIGDSIHAYASIHANAITANDSTVAEIRGSFDPNDKSATPALSPSQVANGNYIYYTIRFQNTGTDTAFSVVITDTLNNQLQAATLQVVNTSHPAKITVRGNVVYFEFINILLPDSNVNEMKSHGYVSFRIKPQPTVTLNNIIPNKAAIYFDYNSPVITNTAFTNIVNPVIIVPLKLISFNVVRATGNKANVYWNTSNEINVQSYSIEMSFDGRNFSNISYEKAKGFQYNDYTKTISIPNNDILYFRLKMTDVDGRFTYSPIVTLRNDQSQSFSFLNNPVKNELNISIQDDALKNTTAKIYNAQGLLVKTILLQHDIETVNVRSLPAGIYYLVTEKGSRQFIVVK